MSVRIAIYMPNDMHDWYIKQGEKIEKDYGVKPSVAQMVLSDIKRIMKDGVENED